MISPLSTFAEAEAAEDGVVVLEADWGGQVLVVARSAVLACDKPTLGNLLWDLAEIACPEDELQGIRLCFQRASVGTNVGGGMGGGEVTERVWVHAELAQAGLEAGIRAVIAGERSRIPRPGPSVDPHERECILRAYRQRLPASGIDFGWGWPDGWSRMAWGEIQRLQDQEIPPRADGQRWYGATLREVVRQAGLDPWVRPWRLRRSLAAAKAAKDALVVLEVEWGGVRLVAAGAALVDCDEATLDQLLIDLAEIACPEDELQGTRIIFPHGRGRALEEVWVARQLIQAGLEARIRAVIEGERPRLAEP